ncbi:hypothetical protein K474DRAFT_1414462 [Panus rudis PR-1116 ss-1]|nr:hypothetical protein K474DRAFT_1414462 [Panus rudis PR-1116 ss-1]
MFYSILVRLSKAADKPLHGLDPVAEPVQSHHDDPASRRIVLHQVTQRLADKDVQDYASLCGKRKHDTWGQIDVWRDCFSAVREACLDYYGRSDVIVYPDHPRGNRTVTLHGLLSVQRISGSIVDPSACPSGSLVHDRLTTQTRHTTRYRCRRPTRSMERFHLLE